MDEQEKPKPLPTNKLIDLLHQLLHILAEKNRYIRKLEARLAEWRKFPPP